MLWYVDTSAFVKLVVAEPESAALRRWAAESGRELFSSDLLRAEVLRAARRLSSAAVAQARHHLGALTVIRLDTAVYERAGDLDPAILRSLDALHLAAALVVGDELEGIVTYDDRLAAAAALHGVEVAAPH
jgi:predicted nucleic acid-binding protein